MAEAFALREDHTGEITAPGDDGNDVTRPLFQGATFSLPDGTLFDVGQALADHGGVIATDEPALIAGLRDMPALKSIAVPDGADLVTSYESRPVAALLELPAARSITGASGMKKDELIARIKLADTGRDPNGELEQPKPRQSARKTANAPGAAPAATTTDGQEA
jgi:hypothetical protein